MTKSTPNNWIIAICGLVYLLSALFLPAYAVSVSYLGVSVYSPMGVTLLDDAPILFCLIVLGIILILAALFVEPKISIIIGAICTIGAIVFCFLGSSIFNLPSYLPNVISAGFGLYLCIIAGIAHIVLEVVLGNQKNRRIQPTINNDDFGSYGSGPIDF